VELPSLQGGKVAPGPSDGGQAGETAIADIHTHPGANTTPIDASDGQRKLVTPGMDRDVPTANARQIPSYAIGKKKLWRFDPRPGGDKKPVAVLTGKDFKKYMGK